MEYLRCDNAGEHLDVKRMLETRDIQIEFTGAHTPERNGVVERRFVIDSEQATAVMISAKLNPWLRKISWAEFTKATSVVSNLICNSVHN